MFNVAGKKIIIISSLCLIIIGTFIFVLLHRGTKIKPNSQKISLTSQIVTKDTEQNNPTKTESEVAKEIVVAPVEKPVPLPIGTDRFIVSLKETNENIAASLFDQGYIKDQDLFTKLLAGANGQGIINPGGYKISKEMTDDQLKQVLSGKPYMKWLIIPEGLRKEEIAELLAKTLGWTTKQKVAWIKATTIKSDYSEGVYFPETYLIPIDEAPELVAARLIAKFNENFAPYLALFTAKNIKWTTALTFASVVQREAANDADTPLIAGILWNRLNQKMQLGVDATLQYMRGDSGKGWWAAISIADKKIDSPYNTYLHTGLPPHPISNPGIPAIEAVLNPAKTDCLYYLHDKNRVTHCATTYEEHQANIEKYLK